MLAGQTGVAPSKTSDGWINPCPRRLPLLRSDRLLVVATPRLLPLRPWHLLPKIEKVSLKSDTLFDFNKSVLKPEGKKALDGVVESLKGLNLEVIIAVGHTDSVGGDAQPEAVGRSRRSRQEVPGGRWRRQKSRVYTEGKGKTQPVADNKTAEGRAKNRRVDIEVVGTREIRSDLVVPSTGNPPGGFLVSALSCSRPGPQPGPVEASALSIHPVASALSPSPSPSLVAPHEHQRRSPGTCQVQQAGPPLVGRKQQFKPLHQINPCAWAGSTSWRPSPANRCWTWAAAAASCRTAWPQRATVLGIDLATKALNRGPARPGSRHAQHPVPRGARGGAGEEQPESFDVVTCMEMLEHVPDPVLVDGCAPAVQARRPGVSSHVEPQPQGPICSPSWARNMCWACCPRARTTTTSSSSPPSCRASSARPACR